jgi:hypothetical protein
MKGKALRRALATSDAIRINSPVPLITDTTELITPEKAQEMLTRNRNNRPVNWQKVEEYADIMRRGEWKLHAQGLILDGDGNILTGQTRLWAVVYGDTPVYFRVSRGNPPDTASFIDRGRPQSARDLATRKTEKKHSPTEASIARAICILRGNAKPSIDEISAIIVEKSDLIKHALNESHRTKKTKSVLMVLAAICEFSNDVDEVGRLTRKTSTLSEKLDNALAPHSADSCWGKGTAFSMALIQARKLLEKAA